MMRVTTLCPPSAPSIASAASDRTARPPRWVASEPPPRPAAAQAQQVWGGPGQPLVLANRAALKPPPEPPSHGLWHGAAHVCAAVLTVWQRFTAWLNHLAHGLLGSWHWAPPAPPAADASQAERAPVPQPAAPPGHPPLVSDRTLRKAVAPWFDIAHLFGIRIVHLRPAPVEDGPQAMWLEDGRSSPRSRRVRGCIYVHLDAQHRPRLLYANGPTEAQKRELRAFVPHLVAPGVRSKRPRRAATGVSSVRLDAAQLAAHLRLMAAVAAKPAWSMAILENERWVRKEKDLTPPAPIRCSALIDEGHTRFRGWGADDRLLIAFADASNILGAQPIFDVALRGAPMRHLRANTALLARYGIDASHARDFQDEVLLQRLLSNLMTHIRKKLLVYIASGGTSTLTHSGTAKPTEGIRTATAYR